MDRGIVPLSQIRDTTMAKYQVNVEVIETVRYAGTVWVEANSEEEANMRAFDSNYSEYIEHKAIETIDWYVDSVDDATLVEE
jgi:hypothetical protein